MASGQLGMAVSRGDKTIRHWYGSLRPVRPEPYEARIHGQHAPNGGFQGRAGHSARAIRENGLLRGMVEGEGQAACRRLVAWRKADGVGWRGGMPRTGHGAAVGGLCAARWGWMPGKRKGRPWAFHGARMGSKLGAK